MDVLVFLLLLIISAPIYTFVSSLPGTDEAVTIAHVVIILLISGILEPIEVFAWFICIMVAFKISDSAPIALIKIPENDGSPSGF